MKKSVLSLMALLICIVIVALIDFYGAPLGNYEIPSYRNIRLGLDLVGGARITYEADLKGQEMSAQELSAGLLSAEQMLRARLDQFGYTEAVLSRDSNNRIIVEIPNVANAEEAVKMLGSTARLEFRDADGNVIIYGNQVKNAKSSVGPVGNDQRSVPHVVLELEESAFETFREATRQAALRAEGENYIAIYLDEDERSKPTVASEYASTGIDPKTGVTITVGGDAKQAKDLAALINIGQMPFDLKQAELNDIGSQLGEEALRTSVMAGFIGMAIVMVFMLVFYRLPGLMADLALAAYIALMVLTLSLMRVNLSLPGIAGIILSIGMAVDANVIIFERIKDELRLGKTVPASISSGFKRAMTAIIDSNVTTVIVCIVLLSFGTGPIKGFATTLIIGVILSMITALGVSRFLLSQMSNMKLTSLSLYGVKGGGAE